jgi:NADPH-dependent 2,4-dienoyl-CoA reductase/sulfur reductase-like enzyme
MKVIIIGGVAAGMTAASKLRRLDEKATIHVYEKGNDLSYSGCGMPYYLGDIIKTKKSLVARFKEDFDEQNIDVFLKHEVIQIFPQTKEVLVKNLITKDVFRDQYDKLLIATGTFAARTHVPGSNVANIYVLNQLEDMRQIKKEVQKGKSVLILGGGYIGIEVAENMAKKQLKVTVIERDKKILMVYDKEIAQMAQQALEDEGVVFKLSENLISYDRKDDKTIVITDKSTYDVDFVIESIGVRPNTKFLKDTDIKMLKNGAIITNDRCETSIKDIYAAGDCATYHHIIKKQEVYVPLGTHANKTGRIVAEQMAGIDTRFLGIVGSNIIKVGKFGLAKTGLGIDEARQLGLNYDFVEITAKNLPGYYPGTTDLFVRIVYEKETGILKGAQLFGEKGVSDRINIMALAITKNLTASEFSQLDFAYAPPFSTVWDPLLVAALQVKV